MSRIQVVAIMILASLAIGAQAADTKGGSVEVISSRPDMVSGGDALMKVSLPAGMKTFKVTAGGRDVTSAFKPGGSGEFLGLVSGLPEGTSQIALAGAGNVASVTVRNHPITGPLLSGKPQQTLLACDTEAAGLGPALDANCSATTKVEYLYKSTAPVEKMVYDPRNPLRQTDDFKPYDPKAPRPADMSTTVGSDGKTVDFIVRRERGTINRGIYEILFRHVPGTPLPSPWMRSPGWNGRLVYEFGGPCMAAYAQQWYLQPTARAETIGAGYAVIASTLNMFGNDCNDVRSAETASMVKEHFIKTFGMPLFTIGRGASGGSMQQYLIAQNYPGIVDGIIPSVNFPDGWTLFNHTLECRVVSTGVASSGLSWTDEQRRAVSGSAKPCGATNGATMWINPKACLRNVPKDKIYDPVTNPKGLRCTVQDNMVNEVGIDPATGFARRPFDNVGTQYGLVPFNNGEITAEQFIALNEKAGGIDVDGMPNPSRSSIDEETAHRYYSQGRIDTVSGSVPEIPILDHRAYTDTWGDVHDMGKSFMIRARLMPVNGGRNHVIWVAGDVNATNALAAQSTASTFLNPKVLKVMDDWLTNLKADRSADSAIEKVARAKPKDAVDTCFSGTFERITDWKVCDKLYPHFGTPRLAAGGPLAEDILKCQLRPLDRADYKRPLSDEQWARLKQVFPRGACDYTKPSVGYAKLSKTWLSY